jgi:hypothetical protein
MEISFKFLLLPILNMANNVGGTTTTHGSTHGAHATNGRAAK